MQIALAQLASLMLFIEGWNLVKLEIRFVERGICPIAKSTMNELFL